MDEESRQVIERHAEAMTNVVLIVFIQLQECKIQRFI